MRVLVFDVLGRYALFRRSYTTTSSISYDFPPRTAVCGLMGAVLGLTNRTSDSSEHLRYFDSARIALRLLKPIRKMILGVNYVETKTGKENRTQILLEVIKDPAYRIYVSEFELFEQLQDHLRNGTCVYTPYLGQAQMIATLRFVGVYELKEVPAPQKVHSVIKQLEGLKVEPEKDLVIVKETMVLNMDSERRPTAHATYWVEKNAQVLNVLNYPEKIYKVVGLEDRICWMD